MKKTNNNEIEAVVHKILIKPEMLYIILSMEVVAAWFVYVVMMARALITHLLSPPFPFQSSTHHNSLHSPL